MLNEIRMFSGDPNAAADWDTNGHGVAGGTYDGWQICNGLNGSPNLTDKFIVGAHMDNSASHTGYNGGWQTFVDGASDLKTGGAASTLITETYLPPLDVILHGFEAKDSTEHASAVPLVDVNYANLKPHDLTVVHYGSNPSGTPAVAQAPFPELPPFYALAYMVFQGYNGTPSI